jgi:formylglycine-generating enzyme required for sulfatase activity
MPNSQSTDEQIIRALREVDQEGQAGRRVLPVIGPRSCPPLLLAIILAEILFTASCTRQGLRADRTPSCPGDMRHVAGATFERSLGTALRKEESVVRVRVSSFCIDRTEVTVEAYVACVRQRGCEPIPSSGASIAQPTHPVTNVTWGDAVDYCKWAHKRLPTDAEWDLAAQGAVPFCSDLKELRSVGSEPRDVSACGAQDFQWSVTEWVGDLYSGDAAAYAGSDPRGPRVGRRSIARGRNFDSSCDGDASYLRVWEDPYARWPFMGFRCALSPGVTGRAMRSEWGRRIGSQPGRRIGSQPGRRIGSR